MRKKKIKEKIALVVIILLVLALLGSSVAMFFI